MILSIQGHIIDIDDKYIINSPYLYTMLHTNVRCDREDEAYVIDVEYSDIIKYLLFIQGNYVSDIDIFLLEYMGHENTMEYDKDIFIMKLHDEWVRDNMYRYQLYEDQLYDLIELPIVNTISYVPPNGWYIAGGAALYMAGYTSKYSDIDLFTTLSKNNAESSLSHLVDVDKCISISSNSITHVMKHKNKNIRIQYILRLYRSLSEIVHGFDLDCVGIIYDGNKLWCTNRTWYSLQMKMNWFDPKRASPSYAYRLVKYMGRGFNIFLPYVDSIIPNDYRVQEYFNMIHTKYTNFITNAKQDWGMDSLTKFKKFVTKYSTREGIFAYDGDELLERVGKLTGKCSKYPIHSKAHYINSNIIPIRDPASLLILAVKYNFYYLDCTQRVHDYENVSYNRYRLNSTEYKRLEYYKWKHPDLYERHYNGEDIQDRGRDTKTFILDISRLRWKSQNPMEQVSSTCNPTPIENIREWYRTSPLSM